MKKKLLLGFIGTMCLFFAETGKAQAPVPAFSINQATVCPGTVVQITDLSTGVPTAWSYSVNGTALATVQNPTVSFNAAGTYTIELVASNVEGPGALASQTVLVNAAPVLALSGATEVCAGGSITQTVTGADTYTWSTGTSGDTETLTPMASGIYSVTGTNALTGCSSIGTVSITVNPLPALSVSGSTAVCIGSSGSQTVTGADSYLWSDGSTGEVLTVSPNVTTTYTVTGTQANTGCTNSITVTLAVNPLPTVSIAGNSTVCAGSPITQTASGADTYLWSDGQTANPATFNPTGTTVYTVTGTYTATGCEDTETVSITTSPTPTLTITGNTAYCAGGAVSPTVTGADTYVWSTGATADTETLNPGTTTSYTVTGTNTLTGCTATAVVEVTVHPVPALSVSGSSAVCLGSSSSQTVTGADTYLWSDGSTGNVITVSPTTPTTYTVTGTNTTGSCTNSITVTLAVNPLPTVSIAGNSTVCAGSTVLQTASGANSYSWNDGQTGAAATFTPSNSGTYTVTGTYTATGCQDAETVSVTAIAIPTLAISGNTAYCIGGSVTPTVSGADTYLWSTGATTDTETLNPTVTTTYTVTGTNTLTGCSSSAPVVVTVNQLPVLAISGPSAACMGSSISETVTGADTYLWSNGSTSDVLTISPSSPDTYTVTGTNAASGCTNSITVTLGVNPLPTVSIAGGSTVCAGSTIVQTASGADSYVWNDGQTGAAATFTPENSGTYTVTGTYTATGCQDAETVSVTAIAIPTLAITGNTAYCIGGSVTPTVSGADTYLWSTGSTSDSETLNPTVTTTYTVTGTNTVTGCFSSAPVTVTVNQLPVLAVSGPSAACMGSSVSETVTGADTYLWDDGSTNNVITLNPTVPTTYTVSGTNALTGCSNTITVSLGVHALPVVSVAGNNTVCSGAALTQTASGADSYVWNNDGSTGDVGTFNPTSNTVYTVTGTSTLTGCSNVATASVTAIALPTLSLAGDMDYCEGGATTLTVSGADTYSWSTGTTLDSESFSPTITTTYTITGTNTLTTCFISVPVTITVNLIPTISVNSGTVCAGDVFTMTPTGAFTYTYSNGTHTVIPTGNDSYTVTGTSAEGCVASNSAIASVTVNARPVVSVTDGTICAGDVFTITPNGANSYNIEGGSATVSPAANASYTVTGVGSDGCLSSNTVTCNITVNALPNVQISANATVCVGETSTLTASGADTYSWSTAQTATVITVSPTGNTTYTVEGVDLNGCVNTATQAVTVNALPTITLSGGTICQGSQFVFSPGGGVTYTYSGGSATVTPASTTSYSVSGTDANGCVSATQAVATVSVVTAVTVTVSGPTQVCAGSAVVFTASGAPNYSWNPGTSASNTLSVTPASNTSYTVTGYNGPCSSDAVASITVLALPSLTVTSDKTILCAGESANLQVSGATSYTWSTTNTGTVITVTPAATTIYTVGGVDNNGCASAASYTQNVNACTGIASAQEGAFSGLSLYPNPSNGSFVIEVQQSMTMTILNNIGQVVHLQELQQGNNAVSLDGQANGIYFVNLKQGSQQKTIKIIKN